MEWLLLDSTPLHLKGKHFTSFILVCDEVFQGRKGTMQLPALPQFIGRALHFFYQLSLEILRLFTWKPLKTFVS